MRRQQRRKTYLSDGGSFWPFIIAACAHLVAAALIAVLPSLTIEQKPEQIVTINLVDMPAPPSSGAAGGPPPRAEKKPAPEPPKAEPKPPVKEEPPPPPPEPKPPPKVEPKPEPPKPAPEPPPKVVSLKSQQQVKKMPPEPPKPEPVKPPKKDEKTVQRELAKIREHESKAQQQRELRKQQAQEEKLRKEAADADAEAAKLMRDLENLNAQSRIMEARAQGLGSSPASSGADSALAQQYYARIKGHLQSHWKLPDLKSWPPNLLATVSITIDKSGKILNVQFQKRSGDDAFDRLVRKAVDDADPLPPIPPALKQERQEFVISYDPGSISGK